MPGFTINEEDFRWFAGCIAHTGALVAVSYWVETISIHVGTGTVLQFDEAGCFMWCSQILMRISGSSFGNKVNSVKGSLFRGSLDNQSAKRNQRVSKSQLTAVCGRYWPV
jgi:hypothetical protein